MKLVDALVGVSRLLLDTSPVIYLVENNPIYSAKVEFVFDRIDADIISAFATPITLAECLVHPFRNGLPNVAKDFEELLVNGQGTTFLPMGAVTARRAAKLRAKYNLPLPDMLQVAAALEAGCDAVITNDLDFKRVTEIPVLVLSELEI